MPALELDAIRHAAGGPFSLTLESGECVGLQGPSGSGKTLLLRAITDLDPHEGEARLDGRPASDFRPSEWRRAVGYLPAESAWWEETVGPHFPDPSGPDLETLLESLDFKLDVLGWTISRLSTGERQRLALARLIVRRPRALLLDEPTAALDSANALRVESLLQEYQREHAAPILLVSHDSGQLTRLANRAYRIAAGSLSPSGLEGVISR